MFLLLQHKSDLPANKTEDNLIWQLNPNGQNYANSASNSIQVINSPPFSVDEIRKKGIISTFLFSGLLLKKKDFWPAVRIESPKCFFFL